MISKYIRGRASVFIDASNIYYSQKRLKWRVDFKKLLAYLKQEVNLVEIYYYSARDLSHNKQTRFLNFLEMIGYNLRSKNIKFIKKKKEKDGCHKGNLDVELTIDILETKDNYDIIVLISGDIKKIVL